MALTLLRIRCGGENAAEIAGLRARREDCEWDALHAWQDGVVWVRERQLSKDCSTFSAPPHNRYPSYLDPLDLLAESRRGPQFVEIVGPALHHLAALRQMSRAVVRRSERIPHGMRLLVLNVVDAVAEHLVQECPRERPEAVYGHLVLAEAHAA